MCGKATTKKLAKSVVAKREEVSLLRGWRWGGMMEVARTAEDQLLLCVVSN